MSRPANYEYEERPSRTIGFMTAPRDWGSVAKCPHCQKTDIPRKAKKQITCGGMTCQLKQNNTNKRKAVKT